MRAQGSQTVTRARPGKDGQDGKGIASQVDYYAVSASKTVPPTSWTAGTPPNMSSTFRYLWKYTLTTFTDGTTSRTDPCVVGVFGVDGLSYRYSKWAAGVEYRNDNNPYYRDSDGKGFIDVVLTETLSMYDPNDDTTRPKAYICRKTHTSGDPVPLAVGEYWAQVNPMAPILSALVIADRIKANFIDVEDLAANSAFIDSLTVNRLVAGIQNGQRVEITPDRKSVNIYDADGSLASTFEGNRYTDISALFGTSSGGVELSVRTVSSWGQAAGVSMGKGSSPTLSGATLGDPMKSYSGKANLCAPFYTSTPTEITLGAGKVTLAARSGVQPSGDKTESVAPSGATAGVDLTVATYSDEACTTQIDSATLAFASLMVSYEQDGTDERTSTVDWAGSKIQTCAGWHRITIKCYLFIQNPGSTADITWGSPTELSGVTYNSDFYVSRYFANGLCLGARGNNYISLYNQASGGMRMKMENGGYGFDFSGGGIMFRRSESEGWKSLIPAYGLPLAALAVGTMNLNSTSPTMGSYRTIEGGNTGMSVTYQSTGTFKVTVPSSWGSSYLVQLTTLGRTDSGNPIGASVSSISSGSFIVDTMSLKGNWVNEAKVMFLITRLEDFNV